MMNSFSEIEAAGASVTVGDCLLGLLSFLTIALGLFLLGEEIPFDKLFTFDRIVVAVLLIHSLVMIIFVCTFEYFTFNTNEKRIRKK